MNKLGDRIRIAFIMCGLVLVGACFVGCGASLERYYPVIERGDIGIALVNGETLQVKDYRVESDRIWFLFIDDVVSWAPVDQVVLESSAQPINTDFLLEYNNRLNSCKKAEWLSVESWELVEALLDEKVEARIGSYETIGKKRERKRTKIKVEEVTLNDLRYYPNKRTVEGLIHVLERDIEKVLSKGEGQINLGKYIPIAADLDISIAIELAEADLRQATHKNRRKKVERCLELYLLSDQDDKLADFFSDPYDWLPATKSPTLKPLLRRLESKVPDEMEYKLYSDLLEGNLDRFTKRYLKQKETTGSFSAKSILTDLAIGTPHKLGSIDDLIQRVKLTASVRQLPFLERMAKFTEGELVSRLPVQSELYGAMSAEVTNTVLYLIEQRRYCGADIPVGTLLWAGIYASSQDNLRAAPLFHLTQKTAGVNFTGQYWGKGALQSQFGVEASGYYIECFERNEDLRQKEPFKQTAHQMSDFAYELAFDSPENSKARRYGYMAFNNRIKVLKDPVNPDRVLNFLQESLDSGKLGEREIMRAVSFAARLQAYRMGDPDLAWETYTKLIEGEYRGVKQVMSALTEYCRIARTYPEQVPKIRENVEFYRDNNDISEKEYQILVSKYPNIFQKDAQTNL